MANPNPPLENLKPFPKGESGNPGGKTSAQRKMEVENAEKATRIRGALLDDIVRLLEAQAVPELDANLLKLIKDSEDRGLGAPKQELEHSGDMSIEFVTIYEQKPGEQ